MQNTNNSGILPSQCRDFMTQSYWEKFFRRIKKEGSETEYFEWYGEYQSFEHLFKLHISQNDKVLHIGCGKSLLAEQLYDNKVCKDILNVDFEKKSLEHMANRSKTNRPELSFQCFSLLDESLPLSLNSFDVILDKGTLDAIYPPSLKEESLVITFFLNLGKALKIGGKLIIVSLLQEHIMRIILHHFGQSLKWKISVYETVIEKSKLYPFFLVITKLAEQSGLEEIKVQQIEKVRFILLNKSEKLLSMQDIMKDIKHLQLQNHFITQVHKLRQGQNFTLDLWSTQNKTTPRYTLYIYDHDGSSVLLNKTCACFIIPEGKGNSFIYGTPQGHKELQKQAQMSRLILARLNAGHSFESLKSVQKELSPVIEELTPKGCSNKPCPFMTDGDEILDKKIIFETDEFVVEELLGEEDQVFRRVVQKSNLDQTQSQVRITYVDEKAHNQKVQGLLPAKKGWIAGIDTTYLDFQAHISMIAGLCFLGDKLKDQNQTIDFLILGGGTGSLSQFLIDHFVNIKVTNIEISEDMVSIAQSLFDFKQDQRQSMLCCDALEYVKQIKDSHQFDCVIVDINSSDFTAVSPPQSFLSEEFLHNLGTLLKVDSLSLVMLNLVDRYNTVKSLPWDLYYSIKCDDDMNEVLFLLNVKVSKSEDGKACVNNEDLEKLSTLISDGVKLLENHKTKIWDPVLNITQYISKIKLRHPKLQNSSFTISDVNVMKDGEVQESGQRKQFYQQDLEKIQKKKNNRKKVNKNR